MNPYDFVRIDWNNEPKRRPAARHDRFEGLSGQIQGTITVETPLFIPATRLNQPGALAQHYATNGLGQAIIPGSSLKGLIRSLVETIAPGCWWLFSGTYRDRVDYSGKLPQAFHPCQDERKLCPACRMFGLISRSTLLKGHVHFDDAVCASPVAHETFYTPILDAPKPRHGAWYLDEKGRYLAGRKFYFHQASLNTLSEQRTSRSGVRLNQRIQPVGTGTTFDFTASFDNLNPQDELPVLLYALVLEPGLRHKLGYAKPAGCGSIRVEVTRLKLIDYRDRYQPGQPGSMTYEGAALAEYLEGQTRLYSNDEKSITLQDLRRIWRWPPDPGVDYTYPGQGWFRENPQTPISKT